jgi:hypothetical protein
LFRRFPRFGWRPRTDQQIVPAAAQADYPELASDFRVLEEQLMPQFRRLDDEALKRQNDFRRSKVILIFGGAVVAVIGAVQAAFPAERWPALVETAVAVCLAAVAFRQNGLKSRERYSAARLRAEVLRSEYFLFLSRVGQYADEARRVRQLIGRIAAIMKDQPSPGSSA